MSGYQKVLDLHVPPDDMLVRLTGPMAQGLAHNDWKVIDATRERVVYGRKRQRPWLLFGLFAFFARGGEDRLIASVLPTATGCQLVFAGDVDGRDMRLLAEMDA